jgi:hypothetical protein
MCCIMGVHARCGSYENNLHSWMKEGSKLTFRTSGSNIGRVVNDLKCGADVKISRVSSHFARVLDISRWLVKVCACGSEFRAGSLFARSNQVFAQNNKSAS